MTPEEHHAAELDALRIRWQAGIWPALFEAVEYCQVTEQVLPRWAALAVLNLILAAYHDGTTGNRGAHASERGRLKMDLAHYLRWSVVRLCLQLHDLTELPAPRRGRPGAWQPSETALLKEAAELLKGNRSAKAGSLKTLRESFELVEASKARGEHRFSFDGLMTL